MRKALALAGLLLLSRDGLADRESKCASRALQRTWRGYLDRYVQADGRVIDPQSDQSTTSEGQAYALVRAAWIGDRARFDTLLGWTRDNLQHGDPAGLPAWHWGHRPDGSWGILDENSASDADQWMAYALLEAADRWDAPVYRAQAVSLLARIWDSEIADVGGRLLPLLGAWARGMDPVPINPSYLLPFAWRSFAAEDSAHPWASLVDPAYGLLAELMAGDLLPPDWIYLSATTGERMATSPDRPDANLYGYEAMRIPWTLAAEVAFYDEPRARHLLVAFARLGARWHRLGILSSPMQIDGQATGQRESLALYGALLPAWAAARPEYVVPLYEAEVRPTGRVWGKTDDYYGQNWAWLGVALWTGLARAPGKSS